MKRDVNGLELDIEPQGRIIDLIISEIPGYQLDMQFNPGDVVVDIGANVGIVSCYLAKKYPFLTIEAYEPIPENCIDLLGNISRNGITNVDAYPYAVSRSGNPLRLYGDLEHNIGGATAYGRGHYWDVLSIAAARVVTGPVRLLKIDCEGMEYEILTPDLLVRVQSIRGETHMVPGQDEAALLATIYEFVPDVVLTTHEPLSIKEQL